MHRAPRPWAGFQAAAAQSDLRRPLVGRSPSGGLPSGLLLFSGSACKLLKAERVCAECPLTVGTREPVLILQAEAAATKLAQRTT